MTEHDVVADPSRIGHHQRLQRRAIGNNVRLESVDAAEHHALDCAAIGQPAEELPYNIWRCITHGQS